MQDLSALNGKTLSELREIAKVLGITDQSLKKRELIARIAEMAAAENDTEENAETAAADAGSAAAVEGDAEPQRKRGRRPRMSSVRIEENKPAGEASSERVRIVVPESAEPLRRRRVRRSLRLRQRCLRSRRRPSVAAASPRP